MFFTTNHTINILLSIFHHVQVSIYILHALLIYLFHVKNHTSLNLLNLFHVSNTSFNMLNNLFRYIISIIFSFIQFSPPCYMNYIMNFHVSVMSLTSFTTHFCIFLSHQQASNTLFNKILVVLKYISYHVLVFKPLSSITSWCYTLPFLD